VAAGPELEFGSRVVEFDRALCTPHEVAAAALADAKAALAEAGVELTRLPTPLIEEAPDRHRLPPGALTGALAEGLGLPAQVAARDGEGLFEHRLYAARPGGPERLVHRWICDESAHWQGGHATYQSPALTPDGALLFFDGGPSSGEGMLWSLPAEVLEVAP